MPRAVLFAAVVLASAYLVPSPCPCAAEAEPVLEAGFGEADVTPRLGDKPVYLAGFGHDRKATAVHDPLLARALVLRHGERKVALVSVDVVGLFHPLVERVRKRLDGFAYVLVSSTHNHEGPDTLGLWGPTALRSGVDPAYLTRIEDQIVKAVGAADGARQAVKARIGSVRAPELLHDGREPYVKHDELVVLAFRTAAGDKPAGLVVQWNCHPETLSSKNTLVSADYIGYTVDYLRKKQGGPVLYLTGTVGGLMTSLHVEVRGDKGELLRDGTFEKTERYGRLVGEAAEKALREAKPLTLTPLEVRQRTVYLPLANRLYLLGRSLGVFEREAFVWKGDPYKAERATKETPAKAILSVRSEIGLLRLGDLEIAAIPGEIYPELVLGKVQDPADPGADFPDAPVEPAVYAQMRRPHRMIVGLANDEIGYIIPKRQWDEDPPFCYGRKASQYGEINSLGPETAPILCGAFRDLLK
jgi:hypothetical protein